MEKKYSKHAFSLLLVTAALYVLAVVLPCTLWLEESSPAFVRDASLFVIFAAVAVYIAAAFLSIGAKSRDNKKPDIKRQSAIFDGIYSYAAREKAAYGKKMKRLYALSLAYISGTVLLFYAASVGAFLYHRAMIPLSAFLFIAVSNTLMRFVSLPAAKDDCVPLGRAQFPVLYGMLDECARALGVTARVSLGLIEDNNATVKSERGGSLISLGFTLVRFLSEVELKSVIMHEMAHIKHADTKRLRRYRSAGGMLSSRVRQYISAEKPLYYWLASRYVRFIGLFELATSLSAETAADEEVKASGDRQAYIDAGAKIVCLKEFDKQPRAFNAYESETPAEGYFDRVCAAFLIRYELCRADYESVCRNQLPPRRPTHPTLPQRMAHFGVDGFRIDFGGEPAGAFSRERREIAAMVNKKYYDILRTDYANKRRVNYLHHASAAAETGDDEDCILLMRAASAEEACDRGLALSIYDKVLSRTPDSSFALMRKGLIMLGGYDDGGLEPVKAATDARSDYAERGCEAVTDYILRRGMRDRVESARLWAIDVLQKKINVSYEYYDFRRGDKLEGNTVRPAAREMISRLASAAGCVAGVYAADKVSPDGFRVNYIGVLFARRSFDTDCEIFFNDLSTALDTMREGDNFFTAVLNINPMIAKSLFSVPASKLYNANDKKLDPFKGDEKECAEKNE